MTNKTTPVDEHFERMALDLRSLGLAMPDASVELPSGRTVRAADAEAELRADMANKSPVEQMIRLTERAFLGEQNG